MEWRSTAAASRNPVTEGPLEHLIKDIAWAITTGLPSVASDEGDENDTDLADLASKSVFAGNGEEGDCRIDRTDRM